MNRPTSAPARAATTFASTLPATALAATLLACGAAPTPAPVVEMHAEVRVTTEKSPPPPPRTFAPLGEYQPLRAWLDRGGAPNLFSVEPPWANGLTGDERATPIGGGKYLLLVGGARLLLRTGDANTAGGIAPLETTFLQKKDERLIDVVAGPASPTLPDGGVFYLSRDRHGADFVYYAPSIDGAAALVELPNGFSIDNLRGVQFSALHALFPGNGQSAAAWLFDRRTHTLVPTSTVRLATAPDGLVLDGRQGFTLGATVENEIVSWVDGVSKPFTFRGNSFSDFRVLNGRIYLGGNSDFYAFEHNCPQSNMALSTLNADGTTTPLPQIEVDALCKPMKAALPWEEHESEEEIASDFLTVSEDALMVRGDRRLTSVNGSIYSWSSQEKAVRPLPLDAWKNGCAALPIAFGRAGVGTDGTAGGLFVCTDPTPRGLRYQLLGFTPETNAVTKVSPLLENPIDGFDGALLIPGDCGAQRGNPALKAACLATQTPISAKNPVGISWKQTAFTHPWSDFPETHPSTVRIAYDARKNGELYALYQQVLGSDASSGRDERGDAPKGAKKGQKAGEFRLLEFRSGKERTFPASAMPASPIGFASEAYDGGIRVLYNGSRIGEAEPESYGSPPRVDPDVRHDATIPRAIPESRFVEFDLAGATRETALGAGLYVASFEREVLRGSGDRLEASHDFGRTWAKVPAPPGGVQSAFECNGLGCTFGFFFRPWK